MRGNWVPRVGMKVKRIGQYANDPLPLSTVATIVKTCPTSRGFHIDKGKKEEWRFPDFWEPVRETPVIDKQYERLYE